LGKLVDTLLKVENRPVLIRDCATMVDLEVSDKSGLSGMAIKAGYATVKAFKAGIIPEVLEGMVDDMVKNLEPMWDDFEKSGGTISLEAYLGARSGQVADALLKISDDRAATTRHHTLKKVYEKLRPTGKKNVEQAVPRVAGLVGRHMKKA
jgi:hypothetical protein